MKRFLIVTFLFISSIAAAQVRFARLFSDHVVLQRQQPIPVWGWGKPRETVQVTLAGQTQQGKADADGKWLVKFLPLEAGGPHKLAISAKSGKAEVNDVLIGEVWLCSGQSNMEWPTKQATNFPTEKKNANYPQIRHFRVDHELALTPQTDLKAGDWKVCSSETVGDFTAIGFFFARELYQKLNIPIGLLHSSWGGSQVEGWISKEGMLSNDELRSYAHTMPTTWQAADSIVDAKLQLQLLGKVNPTAADEQNYLATGYDFSRWKKADPFGQWDWKDMHGFRGQGYMAKLVDIPDDMAGVPTTLALAENDSPNEIYINGTRIAEGVLTGVRKIDIPANTWKAGPNRIVIKFGNMVKPAWYGLGLMGSATDLYVKSAAQQVSLGGDWQLMPAFAEKHEYTRFMNNVGISIYNAMIAPLIPFAIRGVLWYQGESNAGRAYQYRQTFPLLITDWRKKWNPDGRNPDFSFYFVQLSSYGGNQSSNQGSGWAELREAQTMTLSLPKTGMAVTTDIGNPKDIHPTNKQDVGHRLAVNALKLDYGQDINYSSPLYESASFDAGKAIVTFKHTANGLMVKDKYGYLKGFEIAGEDKVFHYAKAEINGNRVIVSHPSVQKPVAVRYAWTDAPDEANLFNSEGFPASPFRTDSWPAVSKDVRFN
ncbi:sialate O-acetylesterase [Spirosoma sp. KCTC 42546]|uniref:sialate O-acetylesterase n=1 Tax=Spirosoma sp. KCTC 42546 TaxID=2520506 RepID=UPI0011585C5A|nr:sialate O-acetylesterase [Spirosoma sp. KCTC 42546]QDK77246.1 sialate O-acetylesterase [Spirosoma sp. KCTC 42546]